MKLQGLTAQQITEAAHIISVLIQAYAADQQEIGRGYREQIIGSLAQVLDDLTQTRASAGRPVAQLIGEFNRRHNPRGARYSAVAAAAPFEIDEFSSLIGHTDSLTEARDKFSEFMLVGNYRWIAVWDNQKLRLIGEIDLTGGGR